MTTLTLRHSFTANVQRKKTPKPHVQIITTAKPHPNNYHGYDKDFRQQTIFETSTQSRRLPEPETNAENLQEVYDECGKVSYKAGPGIGLIRNGKNAERTQFPWLIAFFKKTSIETKFICGGSLVSKKIVVTAAHCIHYKNQLSEEKIKPEDAIFYAGKHNINILGERYNQMSKASEFIIHPEWNVKAIEFDSDIAIAVLMEAFYFNTYVKPICIWKATSSYEDLRDTYGEVAGWGVFDTNERASDTPMYTKIKVVSNVACAKSNIGLAAIVSEKTFCAGIRNSDSGPCTGDSGKF